MSSIREKLNNMFSKVMAGTVTREEGTMLINHLAKEDQADTIRELIYLIDNPPQGVFPKTVLHTIALSRNKAFYGIMLESLEHKNEDVSILAAEELASLKTSDAKYVLMEHLNSEVYHVRKASALALAKGFDDGVEILKRHIIAHPEPFYRLTSAQALLLSGRKGGLSSLIEILSSGNEGAVKTAAEALSGAGDMLPGEDIPKILGALMLAGDNKDSRLIIELLKVVAGLKGRARGFEGFVLAFTDYPSDPVRAEAEHALKEIRQSSATYTQDAD
ncbi:MAG: HEAT repeat domain-containing protein [Deltaproteobacteria bacterium]|nr:HEAT repeat domain-containing protein [Deltaproteobacteria bacterium]